VKRTHRADVQSLTDGAFIAVDGRAWMVHGNSLVEWTAEGYRERTELRATRVQRLVTVLTPPSLVAVLRAGYPVFVHSTC